MSFDEIRSFRTFRRRAGAVLVATLCAGGVAVAGGPAAAASPAAAPVGAPAAPAVVDPADRASVIASFQHSWLPAQAVASGWNGSTASCTVGTNSAAGQQATLDAVNFVRTLAGRPAVTMDAGLSGQALAAALMQDANGALNHTPPNTWQCYTATGAAASGKSNLFLGGGSINGADAVEAYMSDSGAGNEAVGHRRWLLYSRQTRIGSGTSTRANALYVLDSGSWLVEPAGATFAAWPSAGYFPGQLEPGGRWSFSRADADFATATVTVTSKGQTLPTTVVSRANSYGDPTLVWSLAPGYDLTAGDRTYTVKVGYTVGGVATSTRYTTTLVDGSEGLPNRNVISFPQPTAKVYGQTFQPKATNSQGLRVFYFSTTPAVCSTPFTTPATIVMVGVGTCTVGAYVGHDDRYPDAAIVYRDITVSPKKLTVTGPSLSRPVNTANPALRARITGWAAGDSATSSDVTGRAACRTTATTASPRGTYPVRCTQGTLVSGGHYTFTFVPGKLTVT